MIRVIVVKIIKIGVPSCLCFCYPNIKVIMLEGIFLTRFNRLVFTL